MHKYIPNVLQQFSLSHKPTSTPSPLSATSANTPYQKVIQHNTAQPLNQQETTQIQRIIGCLIYYARALDNILLVALNIISKLKQNHPQQPKHSMIIYSTILL